MKTEKYIELIGQGIIPNESPDCASIFGRYWPIDDHLSHHGARDFCIKRGLWTVITTAWISRLAEWIDNRTCLEIMAGGGWIAKGLSDYGIDIVATDDFSWESRHEEMLPIYPVERLDAVKVVQKYKDRQILIISWPPCGDDTILKVCKFWGSKKPIVYIGEEAYGCNAPEEFFDYFWEPDDIPQFPFLCWPGLHDQIIIGYFRNNK